MTTVERRYAPLHQTSPGWSETDGDLAAQLAADLGWQLDEVQQFYVDACLAVGGDGVLPACRSVAIVGPRQTVGKTVGAEVAALFDVLIAEVPLHVWTAHLYATAQKTFHDMQRRLMKSRDYASRVEFRETNGEQQIIVDGSRRIEFHARSGKRGRGFTTPRLTLDEWLYGKPGDIGALAPTGVTQPDFQIRYASSAGFEESKALRTIRDRGRKGGDPSLAYVELGAQRRACGADRGQLPTMFSLSRCRHELDDPTCALNDPDLWWQSNSGLWSGRVREADVAFQRRELPPAEFAREFLSWWEDPPHEDGGALDVERFGLLANPTAERGRPVSFGVAVAPDRSWAAVAAAWPIGGGLVHVMSVDYRPHATWVRERVDELRRKWGGRVVVDSRARTVWPEDESPGWLSAPGEIDQALAEAALSDRIEAGTVRHGNEPELLTAVRGARWQASGVHRRLVSSGIAEVSPVRAAALAAHAASSTADPLAQLW